jgi:hypothetical protein
LVLVASSFIKQDPGSSSLDTKQSIKKSICESTKNTYNRQTNQNTNTQTHWWNINEKFPFYAQYFLFLLWRTISFLLVVYLRSIALFLSYFVEWMNISYVKRSTLDYEFYLLCLFGFCLFVWLDGWFFFIRWCQMYAQHVNNI